MANMLFANNCNTTLNGGITAVATSMVVTSATGFPVPTGSQYFYCTLADAATQTTIEIVKVTAVAGTTFTIVRGQDGTSGTIFASGAVVSLRLVRASLNDFPKLDEDNIFTGVLTSSGTTALTWNGAAATTAQIVAGTTGSASSLFINTPSVNGSYGSGFGVDGTYGTPSSRSVINLHALGTKSGGPYGSDMAFYTSANTTESEKMRIFSSGGVSIGNTTDPGATNLSVTGTVSAAVLSGTNAQVASGSVGGTFKFGADANTNSRPWVLFSNGLAYGDLLFQQGSTNTGGTYTTRLYLGTTGGFSVGNTTDAGAGNISAAGTVKTGGYTVATLPTGVTGARAYVTNALAPTYGATVVGGGAVTIPVFYNGTNWIVG